MAKLFISYRRQDCRDHVERIHDRLVRDLKGHHIFLDVDLGNIPGAMHYEDVIKQAVSESAILLAIIGEGWINARDKNGNRRLDDPHDFVRQEISAALHNNRTKVIPVIALGGAIPAREELPEDLRGLVDLQIVAVRRNPDFHRDMNYLVQTIQTYLPQQRRITPAMFIGTLVGVMLLTALATYLIFGRGGRDTTEIENTLSVFEVAVAGLTSEAETLRAPTSTPTIDRNGTIRAIQGEIIATETARALAVVGDGPDSEGSPPAEVAPTTLPPTQTPTASLTPSPSPTITPSPTANRTATAQFRNEQATQRSQLEERQATNTPVPTQTQPPTATQTASPTPSPTATLTQTATQTATPTLDFAATAGYESTQQAVSTRVYEQALATLDAQITATAQAAAALGYGEVVYHVDNYGGNDRELVTSYLDGSNLRQLTSNGADDISPDWSPDGRMIIFNTFRQNQRDLYLLDLATGEETPLTDDARVDFAPQWSPDGTRVVYYAFETAQSQETNIYVVEVGTGEVTRLTEDGDSINPDWSPDGSEIIFSSRTERSYQLYTMNSDGSEQRPLNPDAPIVGIMAAWSPTGEEIAYLDNMLSLHVIEADGSNPRLLLDGSYNISSMNWSPDGQWLIFSADVSGNRHIYAIDRTGNHLQQLTWLAVNELSPALNPFTNTDPLINTFTCEDSTLPARLTPGGRGRIIAELNLFLRAEPTTESDDLTRLPPLTEFTVLTGPVCVEGSTWWQIDYEGQVGWLSEGRADVYWLEPVYP